jgi:uncharacterized RDD family membrane protein YckC
MHPISSSLSMPPYAPLWRRLAAAAYDSLVVVALWFAATALLLPLTHGEALDSTRPVAEVLYRLYLLAVGFAFFGGFWVRSGQTLGMLAWRVKVVGAGDGGGLGWRQALTRYLAAILSWALFGAGFWWSLLDVDGKTWHDRLSDTALVMAQPIGTPSDRGP